MNGLLWRSLTFYISCLVVALVLFLDALRFVMTCDLGSCLLSELSEIVFDELVFSA